MQSFIDRLVAGGVLGGLPTEAAYPLFMFLFAAIVVFGFVLPLVTITIWLERRVWSRIQSRVGPNRVGPQGVLQGLADGVKNILKEDVIPDAADRPLFAFAPYLLVWGFIATFVVVPFSSALIVADLNVGLLYIVAIVALSAVGVLMAPSTKPQVPDCLPIAISSKAVKPASQRLHPDSHYQPNL